MKPTDSGPANRARTLLELGHQRRHSKKDSRNRMTRLRESTFDGKIDFEKSNQGTRIRQHPTVTPDAPTNGP
jgi:hypothetical protein